MDFNRWSREGDVLVRDTGRISVVAPPVKVCELALPAEIEVDCLIFGPFWNALSGHVHILPGALQRDFRCRSTATPP